MRKKCKLGNSCSLYQVWNEFFIHYIKAVYLVKFEGSWVLFTISSISLYQGSLYQGLGVLQNKGPVHFKNYYILGKFFVWRFYSRHISSWLNYSGEFIVRRFYSSRNNRTPPSLRLLICAYVSNGKEKIYRKPFLKKHC